MSDQDKQKTILLVDDDPDFLLQISTRLRNEGFRVITAEGQSEAEKMLEDLRPDMVISDLMMEHYDGGFGLAEHIRKTNSDIPIIICTSVTNELGFKFSTDTQDEREWIKADAVLNKPIRFEQLMKEINKYFS
ncbi:MAG: response regulator [Candidatus Kapaibacterium sp.]